jgi:hypothetical protein
MTTKLDPATLRWVVRYLRREARYSRKRAAETSQTFGKRTSESWLQFAESETWHADALRDKARAAERRRKRG